MHCVLLALYAQMFYTQARNYSAVYWALSTYKTHLISVPEVSCVDTY